MTEKQRVHSKFKPGRISRVVIWNFDVPCGSVESSSETKPTSELLAPLLRTETLAVSTSSLCHVHTSWGVNSPGHFTPLLARRFALVKTHKFLAFVLDQDTVIREIRLWLSASKGVARLVRVSYPKLDCHHVER